MFVTTVTEFFPGRVMFSENDAKFHVLPTEQYICIFCVFFFTDGVNLGTYCENLRTYCVTFCTNVEIKVCKAKAFHWLIQFQTISALAN